MSSVSNPRDLVLLQLAELLWVERILEFEALPALRDAARDEELRASLAGHLEQTRTHVERVEHALRAAGAEPASARSAVFAALQAEHARQAEQVKEPALRDVLHAAGAARAEHLELALYAAAAGLAAELGLDETAKLLDENRREDERALEQVERIAARLRRALADGRTPL